MQHHRPTLTFWRTVFAVFAAAALACSCTSSASTDSDADGDGTSSVPVTAAISSDPVTNAPPPPPSTDETTPCSTASWGLEQQVASLVFASVEANDRGELDRAVRSGAGGIFITTAAAPLLGEGEVNEALADVAVRPLVGVDEEGGRVQRLRKYLGTLPNARQMAETMTPDEIRNAAAVHGSKMHDLGVTIDFAPVADVSDEPANGPIGDRSFANDPAIVGRDAKAFAQGLHDAGVMPTLKHFPGHGHASGDSHTGAVTTPPLAELEDDDLVPYREILPSLPVAVMVGHLVVPELTDGLPASVSKAAVTGLLREQMGFDGLVVTDDLGGMRAILDRYSVSDAAVRAIGAGVDMVLVPSADAGRVREAVIDAVERGEVSPEQVRRSADRVLAARLGC